MNRSLLLIPAALLVSCSGASKSTPVAFHYDIPDYVVAAGDEHYECFFVHADTGGTDADPRGALKFSYTAKTNIVHHMVVFTSEKNEANGTHRSCYAFENGWNFRYAGGLETNALEMPAGVAMPLKPHEIFVIQIHYLNASTAPVTDNSAVDIQYTEPGATYEHAAVGILGSTDISIPSDGVPHDVVDSCNISGQSGPVHVFGLWPHMHQVGTHFRVDLTIGGTLQTPIDEPWNFGDQKLWLYLPPATPMFDVNNGDTIKTTCTYTNNTGHTVTVGESSTQEMCFNFVYLYPEQSAGGC